MADPERFIASLGMTVQLKSTALGLAHCPIPTLDGEVFPLLSDAAKKLTPQDQLIFLHVPKTAGSTLRGILFSNYDDRIAPIYSANKLYLSPATFAHLSPDVKDRSDIVVGHISHGFHRFLSGRRPFVYATMLREPVSRCVSLFSHLSAAHLRESGWTLSEMLEVPNFMMQFNNHQTRIISGLNPGEGGISEDAMMERAMSNIEREFAFTGLSEHFDESLILAQADLGWELTPYVRRNISPRKWRVLRQRLTTEGPDSDMERLAELNALDASLYEFVKTRFFERLDLKIPDWRRQLEGFRSVMVNQVPSVRLEGIGSLGGLRRHRILGWARLRRRDDAARVRVQINDEEPFEVVADRERTDLRAAGLSITGMVGFCVDLPVPRRLKTGDVVRAWLADIGVELSGSPRRYKEQ